ncbi:peptide chain release factor N(5)-glutamine methyltransferase [Altererythrobacter arenosus]|uniref:Release factor glutamine methyltransferase n=1 Tax=Altererythrobacter arenosus TaxID=3032592 RepID=A0ABY8FXD1_9SPHN|nr:peptide chain release factor N(5)-glutamine methyltransferase [Altererythrobacter sp. CAU 1644]WFL78895.1 peptide chain release factor N(5)-glutamine methyltransferase [Altererythrobacter sp. CAU 1644]
MTVAEAIRDAAQRLSHTSDTARLDAELLMARVLGTGRSEMLLRSMADPAPAGFAELVDRRAAHEPIAYILGQAEFYGRSFLVNPGVLIPRGDSESVVEAALAHAPGAGRVLDLGTGSGALLLTILAERPGLTGVGIDASLAALPVAAANAARLGLAERARMLRGDWRQSGWADDIGRFELVIANPPYVETSAELDPDVRDFEPTSALFSGEEGLDDYRAIIPQLGKLISPGGVAVLEIGRDQGDSVAQIAHDSGFSTTLVRDLAHRPRGLILR